MMSNRSHKLRDDALAIWQAGVDAVAPRRVLRDWVEVDGSVLRIGDEELDLASIGRLVVVGAGKAGAAMTLAIEEILGDRLLEELNATGWVNVPADCVQPTQRIHLHAARPAGLNEPTEEGVVGARRILQIVESLGPADLCLCLISGGGSALLPAPNDGFNLADKAEITRAISARGGSIEQLNTVRRELSLIKGGGLALACRAGRLIALILSDVLGDDVATIASGPTVLRQPTPDAAIDVLKQLGIDELECGERALAVLQESNNAPRRIQHAASPQPCITNLVIGNNAVAVDAAGVEAERRGYSHAMLSATQSEGSVSQVAERLVQMVQRMRTQPGPDCLIAGGEPTVELAPIERRGMGGRNQQLCLEAAVRRADWHGAALLSGGTDGEDGPTDAAGAIVDEAVMCEAARRQLDPHDFARRNDAYHFFEPTGGLIKTGPTHTNVCDLRVITVDRSVER